MARQPQDREDLLAEATALVERIELVLPGYPEPVVAGFRSSGCASLFFGPDPVYQFNSQRQLRRAFAAGLPYKAERGRLVSLTRTRTGGRLELVRGELDAAAQARFLKTMSEHLAALRSALDSGNFDVLGQVPATADLIAHLGDWFSGLDESVEVAASPHAK
jgi:hypothetical protein